MLTVNDPVIRFFGFELLKTPLLGYRIATNLSVGSLVRFMGSNWRNDLCMEAGLDVLRDILSDEGSRKVLLQPPSFWEGCERTFEDKSVSAMLSLFQRELDAVRHTVEVVYFPFVYAEHWYLAGILFISKEILLGDSLLFGPPPDFVRTLLYFLEKCLGQDPKEWRCVGIPFPRQRDGHSCGVVALTVLEALLSEAAFCSITSRPERWTPQRESEIRMDWLRRIIERHRIFSNPPDDGDCFDLPDPSIDARTVFPSIGMI
jgi:hypothetical protein